MKMLKLLFVAFIIVQLFCYGATMVNVTQRGYSPVVSADNSDDLGGDTIDACDFNCRLPHDRGRMIGIVLVIFMGFVVSAPKQFLSRILVAKAEIPDG
jgi:hypothetical protein